MSGLLTVEPSAWVPDNSAAHTPAIEVDQGELFCIRTNDRFAPAYAGGAPAADTVGALIGPVLVRGIRPGDVIGVEIVSIRASTPYAYVLTSHRYGMLGQRVEPRVQRVNVDAANVTLPSGLTTAYRPMIGKLGLAPPGQGVAGTQSGDYGGALSNTQLRPGATVYLRAYHDGGLLTLEDVHAGMGDGEATASAFEMAAEVTLRCVVGNELNIEPPIIITDTEVLTLGQAPTLDEAVEAATETMLALIQARTEADLTEAAMLVGSAVDLRIAFIGSTPKQAYAAIPKHLLGL